MEGRLARTNEFRRVSRAPEGTTGKGMAKTAALHDPADGASTVRPISTARKRPTIGQTQKLLLAALRLWELKNRYRR